MALGGIAGALGLTLPLVELGIAVSLVVLGLAVTLSIRLPVAASALLVGLFALFHGHAHGSELPETASALAYGIGFVAATAALHGIGIATGVLLKRDAGRLLVRLGGAGIAATGLLLVATL
jgi:urease accessory protein